MNDKIERLGDKAQKPIIDGRDLIEYGFLNRALYKSDKLTLPSICFNNLKYLISLVLFLAIY